MQITVAIHATTAIILSKVISIPPIVKFQQMLIELGSQPPLNWAFPMFYIILSLCILFKLSSVHKDILLANFEDGG